MLIGVANLSNNTSGGEKSKILKFPYLILAVSILLTIGITYNFYKSARAKDLTRFTNEVGHVQSAIDNKINAHIALLKGARGFAESSQELKRKGFASYIGSLNLERNYAGVLGIGFNRVVKPGERENFIKTLKSENLPDFKIYPEGERDSYNIVSYLEPQNEGNRKLVGYDMATDASRLMALEQARDSATFAATGKIISMLGDAAGNEPGFLIYLPIYRDKKIPLTTEERRQNIIGYIFSPVRAKDFLDDVQKDVSASGIEAKIYDAETKPENLLWETAAGAAGQNFSGEIDEPYAAQKELDVAGRRWIAEYNSLPAFAAQSSVGWTPLIFLCGMIFSFLLFGMTYWEAFARAGLIETAEKLTESEKQKQNLLEKEQKARAAAEQANATKDEFIAVISHELRTPLNAIAGWSRILRTDNLSQNTQNLALEKIDKNLRAQASLVEELLEYSQILSGRINLEGSEIDFSRVFETAFQEIEPKAREKNIEFVSDNQLDGQLILGDEDKLKIVVHNLLTNAVKFTHKGGRIETRLSADDSAVQMIVTDNGKGISREFLPHVFDRFSQADTSITRGFGGLGLGLTISKHIVKLHNGVIEAGSEGIGKGSVFKLKLPLFKSEKLKTKSEQ